MNRIKEIRTTRGLSQACLAELTGAAQSAISNYERNAKDPTLGVAARIAEALGVTIDDLRVKDAKAG